MFCSHFLQGFAHFNFIPCLNSTKEVSQTLVILFAFFQRLLAPEFAAAYKSSVSITTLLSPEFFTISNPKTEVRAPLSPSTIQ
jgi:hypothetical protein